MRAFACAMGVAGVVAVAGGAPVPKDGPKAPAYFFPTQVGATAVYEAAGAVTHSQTVTAAEERDGVVTVTCDLKAPDGRVIQRTRQAVSAAGVTALGLEVAGGPKSDLRMVTLKLPAKAGDTWSRKADLAGTTMTTTVTVGGGERVTVPAGSFECVRLEMEMVFGGQTTKATVWHAAGVGVVRSRQSGLVRELRSFTTGKD